MTRLKSRLLTLDESLVGMVFVALGTLALLMPVHNDTWWHLRNGQEMFRTHTLLFEDRFSFTAYGEFFWNHSWLSQLLLYPVYVLGGPPLLTAFCALMVVGGWLMTWRLMTGDTTSRILLFALALSSATPIWSIRPQVFSVVFLPLLAKLAMQDRWLLIVPVVVVWSNLHAGVAMGVAVLVASVLAALVSDREKLAKRIAGLCASVAATLINPVGVTAWLELERSMARSRANEIEEWMAPSLEGHLIFWLAGGVYVFQALSQWRRLRSPGDRVLVMAALVALPVAGLSVRSVPAFMMLMAPAFSRLLRAEPPLPSTPPPVKRQSALATALVGALALAAIAVVSATWTTRWARLAWDPVSPAAASAIASCPAPLYNAYGSGGPLIWFVPTQPVFIDSRQDQYPISLVQEGTRVEATGDYRRLFERYRFNCAAVQPQSPMALALRRNGWRTTFTDRDWTVLTRPRPLASATTGRATTGK